MQSARLLGLDIRLDMIDNNQLQSDASDPKNSVYVSASAGSGKTKVLIDRILRLLLSGTEISNILCITFTKVAAEEMVSRLKSYTQKWLFIEEELLIKELTELTRSIVTSEVIERARSIYMILLQNRSKIKIQTVHSFCANILNIKLDQNNKSDKKIISNADQLDFLTQSFDHALSNPELSEEINLLFSVYSDQTIFDYITDLIKQHAKFSNYLNHFRGDQEIDILITDTFGVDLEISVEKYIESQVDNLGQGEIHIIAKSLSHSGMLEWLGMNPEDRINNLNDYILIFLTKDDQPRARITGASKLSSSDTHFLKDYQNKIYALADKIKSYKLAAINLAFIKFSKAAFNKYNELKNGNNSLDYDELLLDTIKALSASDYKDWLLWRLDCEIDHILVDEAQDLNSYQWHIINLLADEFFAGEGAKDINRTIFIVGDLKQSIFSFQGAEPKIFENIKYYYRKKAADAHKNWLEIDFNVSYRSGMEILKVVDNIFVNDKEAFGTGHYNHHVSYRQTNSLVEVWPLVLDDKEEEVVTGWKMPKEYTAVDNKYTRLADLIVKNINDWLSSKKTITGTDKIIEPQDIMIIMRKRGPIYSHIISSLRKCDIPFSSGASAYLTEYLITLDIISVAKFILNPLDDFNLLSLLKSYFFNMSESEIFEIAYNSERPGIWKKISTDSAYDGQKRALYDMISIYKAQSLYGFFYNIIFKYLKPNIKKDTLLFNMISESFLESVLEFQHSVQFHSLESFLRWFKMSEKQLDSSQSSDDGIKITTTHSAKGLQSPVVIIADASESENLKHDGMFWHDNKVIFTGNIENETDLIRNIKAENKNKNYQENKRLLYVGLTRAKDELYISGVENKRSGTWYEIVMKHNN